MTDLKMPKTVKANHYTTDLKMPKPVKANHFMIDLKMPNSQSKTFYN